MHRRLKERLIGAAVLVMLAVIFIPMILDDTSHTESAITESNIPAKPDTEFNSRVIPVPGSGIAEITGEPDATPAPAAPETVVPETPVAPEDPGTREATHVAAAPSGKEDLGLTAWVVQLGSFSSEANAEALNDELRRAGFSSFVEPLKQGARIIYRVRVGPELLRSDAQSLKDQLHGKLQLDGIILAYP